MPEIRVALVGVGNSASALIQGTQYYKDAKQDTTVPGLMHVNYGGYHIRDIRFVAAFEVNKAKIGKDLSEAIFTKPNVCVKFADVPNLGVKVSPAPILDGVAPHMRETFNVYDDSKNRQSKRRQNSQGNQNSGSCQLLACRQPRRRTLLRAVRH